MFIQIITIFAKKQTISILNNNNDTSSSITKQRLSLVRESLCFVIFLKKLNYIVHINTLINTPEIITFLLQLLCMRLIVFTPNPR